jgi:hypothetical protein
MIAIIRITKSLLPLFFATGSADSAATSAFAMPMLHQDKIITNWPKSNRSLPAGHPYSNHPLIVQGAKLNRTLNVSPCPDGYARDIRPERKPDIVKQQ